VIRTIDFATKLTFGWSPEQPHLDFANRREFDVVHLHNLPWLGRKVRKASPNAHVQLYVHNTLMNGVPAWTMRRRLRDFDEIICVSEYIRLELLDRAKIGRASKLRERFRTVFNGVDSSAFAPTPQKSVDVTFVGRLVPEKGVHVLADAMKLVSARRSATLRIVGGRWFLPSDEPANANTYESDVAAKLADLQCEMTGPLPPASIPALMCQSRIVVVPSTWPEPCALVVLEAMASGACVIASRTGGIAEIPESSGIVHVPPQDPEALAVAIDNLLEDPELAAALGRASRNWAQQRSWVVVARELYRS
jgi:glycosyltransferase involved in cell wall biosynthesis